MSIFKGIFQIRVSYTIRSPQVFLHSVFNALTFKLAHLIYHISVKKDINLTPGILRANTLNHIKCIDFIQGVSINQT